MLKSKGRTHVLHRFAKGFDPSLVGAETLIGFLPNQLQPYKANKIILYISAIRTNGGGGGQCGSGAEIFLNVLDLKPKGPTIIEHHLIGSCSGIELENVNQYNHELGNISAESGRVVLKFASYRGYQGNPAATLSRDFKRLEFDSKRLESDGERTE